MESLGRRSQPFAAPAKSMVENETKSAIHVAGDARNPEIQSRHDMNDVFTLRTALTGLQANT